MIKNESYYVISGWMINELKLKGVALNVFAIIYGITQDGTSVFSASRQYLADFTTTTRPTIDKALNELIDLKLIIKETNIINNVLFNSYKVNFETIKNLIGYKETLQGYKETLPNNINNNINNINIYKDIINYLNITCNKNYKYNIDKTKKLIDARIKEGFTKDDFKKVIDNKKSQWLNDEKMNQYLRPETLFGTKFESYLNTETSNNNIKDDELI